jgi:hypothetical protein
VQLIVIPFFDSCIALALNLFEICLVDETHLGVRSDHCLAAHSVDGDSRRSPARQVIPIFFILQ